MGKGRHPGLGILCGRILDVIPDLAYTQSVSNRSEVRPHSAALSLETVTLNATFFFKKDAAVG